MKAKIITIGDEILLGQIVDTNSGWVATKLHEIGVEVIEMQSISDTKMAIIEAVDNGVKQADVLLITGGLGPTKDDITKSTLTEYFNDELVFNESVFENVKQLFANHNIPMPSVNREQAMLPKQSEILTNTKGTAPGMCFSRDDKLVISMPGVPHEVKHLMHTHVLPKLANRIEGNTKIYKTVLTQGIGETSLLEIIGNWENEILNKGMTLAWLPSPGTVRLRVGAGSIKENASSEIDSAIEKLKLLIPSYFIGVDLPKLEVQLGKLLKAKGWTLATAESCTGGRIAHQITSVPGCSEYFLGSVVSYANEVKEATLKVNWHTLNTHGAVSEQVVLEMINGVKRQLGVDCAIATSGIAGPDGGTAEKPVGTIWIAVSTPKTTVTKKLKLGRDRETNIKKTSILALQLLHKELMK